MNWIKILNHAKYIALFAFIFLIAGKRFNLFENYKFSESVYLFDFKLVLVLLFLVLYQIELRLELKAKNKEIEQLKIKLKNN